MFISKVSEGSKVLLKLPIQSELFLNFESQMILKSNQKYFADVSFEDQLIWDITGLMTVNQYISLHGAEQLKIRTFIKKLIEGILSAEDFFLDGNSIILDTDYIFYDHDSDDIKLIYVPILNQQFNNIYHQFKKIALSWLYALDLSTYKSLQIKDLIVFLQNESSDLIHVKNYLNKPYKRKVNKRIFKSKSNKEKINLNKDETVCLKSSVPHLLLKHKKVYLDKEMFRIGRGHENDLILEKEQTIGRLHSEIVREASDFYILDCNSTNGTYLNGNLLIRGEKYKLNHQDMIQFAKVKAIFKII